MAGESSDETIVLPQTWQSFEGQAECSQWQASLRKKLLAARALAATPAVMGSTLLALGCLLVMVVLSNLQGAGRGFAVLGNVTARAQTAYQHLVVAQQALAETDFQKSETEFAAAEKLLQQAHEDLSQALSASGAILRYVDLTGRVRSGEELLNAGQSLTQAGQRVSRGVSALLHVNVFKEDASLTMVDALASALEEFTAASEALEQAERSLELVDRTTLPAEIAPKVAQLQDSVPRARAALTAFLDQSQSILSVLGAEHPRQYLLLFENNHEMRPTGGFIGSIALLNIDRGVVENIDVQTVYDPDGQLKEFIAPPNPLRFITSRWFMRDANWFVDYPTTAQKIAGFFEKEGGPTVDGVMAMTPEVIRELLTVTGPIELPAYGVTVDKDNFVVLTQDQVTYSYDRETNRPKEFLRDLTPLLLSRLFNQPADSSLKVLGALGKMISEKQLLIYFRDPDIQSRIHRAGWDGTFPVDAPGFLSVNNANIGGHKSDQFVSQEIDYRAEVAPNGDVDVVVTIRRTHHGPDERVDFNYPRGEDPADKDNVVYQRVFVPRGALLLDASGFTPQHEIPRRETLEPPPNLVADESVATWQQDQTVEGNGTVIGHEAGYRYFANWIVTPPGATTVALYRYRLPNHVELPGTLQAAQPLKFFVAKQPGDTRTQVRFEVQLPPGYKIVHTVPSNGVTLSAAHQAVYRGHLRFDLLFGLVVTKE